jgi:hypothetical protein
VMRECFVPMIDPRTRINLLSQALYNRRWDDGNTLMFEKDAHFLHFSTLNYKMIQLSHTKPMIQQGD